MNIKLNQSKIILILALSLFLFSNINYSFSQTLSFDELQSLQKSNKKEIGKFLQSKSWLRDSKSKNKWVYYNTVKKDSIESMFVLQDENCNQNIINYITNSSNFFEVLKDSFIYISEPDSRINFKDRRIADYFFKDLYIRFFNTDETNHYKFYAVWIFSKTDGWYYKNLDKFCFPIIEYSNTKKEYKSKPEFPGGEKEKSKFMSRNLEYPFAASEKGIEGTVIAGFYVEIDGSLTNIEIIQGVEGGFNEEVLRLLKMMPKWKPGTEDGEPVRYKYSMPVKFSLKE